MKQIKKVAMVSLGCSKNLVDAEEMLGILEKNGFENVDDESEADVILVNTCAFIDAAKQESIDCILEMAEYKKENPNKAIVVTGCLAQRFKEEILKELPEVDAVVGTNDFYEIAKILKEIREREEKQVFCSDIPCQMAEDIPRVITTPSYTAYLKIAEGCDNHCTYCVIPSIRGAYRSRKKEDIVKEAQRLAGNGVKELIVIAQDTTRYGMDLYGKQELSSLLNELCEIDGIKWIRLHYCYPELVSDELIDTVAKQEKICNYMDIPIQHCNNEILKKMGRRTSKEEITALIKKLREKIPDIIIRTSLISGFPQETYEQAEELRDFVSEMNFDRLGVFTYSKEENTPAARLDGQIDEEEKLCRKEMIMVEQAAVSEELNMAKIGKTYEVLTEGYDSVIKLYYGRSYAESADVDGKIFFKSKEKLSEGDFVQVLIEDAMEYDLYGKKIQ